MNERIKLLAKQAGITIVSEPFDDASRSWNDTMEKFAELIVRECAEVAHCNFHVDGLTSGGIMKQHFGVE